MKKSSNGAALGRIGKPGLSSVLMLSSSLIASAGAAAVGFAGLVRVAHSQQVAQSFAVIEEIVVSGNLRIDAETVLSFFDIVVGDRVSGGDIDSAVKSLFATGLFADVVVDVQDATLVVSVRENPVVNRIAYEGNRTLDDEDLAAEIDLSSRSILTKDAVSDDIERILRAYRLAGYYAASVEPSIIEREQNRVDLIFEIDEGQRTRVADISFIGNEAFSDGRLLDVIQTAETRWWRLLSAADIYDPDRLRLDQELLRRHYIANGYADFQVKSAVAELSPDRSAFYIVFQLDEGPIYRFGESAVVTTGFEIADIDALRSRLGGAAGSVYNAETVRENTDLLVAAARDRGYAFARVVPKVDKDDENLTVSIVYEIEQGRRAYIERINIRGNDRTRDYVIRRRFAFAEGDAFNQTAVEKSRRDISALGFFENVAVSSRQGSAADRVVIDVDVKEVPTGELSVGAGITSSYGVTGDFSLSERNFMGRGQFVRARVNASRRRQQVDLSFTEPYFLERDLSFGINVYGRENDLRKQSSYRLRQIGGGVNFGFPIARSLDLIGPVPADIRLSTRYDYSVQDIYDIEPDASLSVKAAAGLAHVSKAGYTVTADARDDVWKPTEGWYAQFRQDIAGLGGDRAYIRTEIDATAYAPLPVLEDAVFSLRAQSGHIAGWQGERVSLNDRFFKGGPSFRGFELSGIGPRDVKSGDALGGRSYAIGTAEVQFPFYGTPRELGLGIALFVEAGSLFDIPESSPDIRDDKSVRASIGASLLWRSPVGPFRFDFSHVVSDESYDRKEFFRFSGGARF